ncbi:MAG: glycosyltransferase [Bacteroidota bacterium]|nr:glycosyltransferase [Bacteroidota bacterium]
MDKNYDPSPVIKADPPKKRDIRIIRLLIAFGLVVMLVFVVWFIRPEHIGFGPIYWLLTFALLFKLIKMIHEWYHYWSVSIPVKPDWKTQFTVDVLTTACPGEPKEMIIKTLKKMVLINYPHTNYLCDEGNDPELKAVCKELGVIHVTREIKVNAKAGNINNALKQASGEICLVLDPDHEPVPEFLDNVLPFFENPEIGFVQCVQGYSNHSESIIARGAAEQTYHFYGPMMMCMNSYGTVQAIGANCTFRREALDSIGGHAAGLSEDMHTAMQLHAKGWKSVYVPEMLTKGLVPATLSAYYQQQLKWSRGTFELLFRVFPQLYSSFTWRQKLHYFTIPMYFLFGLINFIDILIPILALCLAQVPWAVDLADFALLFLPLCGLSMMIRLFAQRWLLEKHERGFHLAGGLVRAATWWIFLIGFVYAIFNIKVPYIPTPKGDEHRNYWKLCLPNILVVLLCGVAVLYGLSIDWTPYSFAMASYSMINAGILGFVVFMSQQKFLNNAVSWLKSFSVINHIQHSVTASTIRIQNGLASLLRNGPVAILIGLSLVFLSYNTIDESEENISGISEQKLFGGFYVGSELIDHDFQNISQLSRETVRNIDVVSMYDTLSCERKINSLISGFSKENVIPLVRLAVPSDIMDKKYKPVLEEYARVFRSYGRPVFLNVLMEGKMDESTRLNWQYLYTFFNDLGISNLTWVWVPGKSGSVEFYPGPLFVDWLGLDCLNYESNSQKKEWYSFAQLYNPQREIVSKFQKPVMITSLGCIKGSSQNSWIMQAFKDVKENFKEIRSMVIFNGKKEFNITNNKIYSYDFELQPDNNAAIKEVFAQEPFNKEPFLSSEFRFLKPCSSGYRSSFIQGDPGKFRMIINGKEQYIKGIGYNTGHDWRDGNMPLTRRQLEKDFSEIKKMGANTIRRYDNSIYDKNILNIAGEFDLKVLYGFWFDPKIDYYRDTLKVKQYIAEVEDQVLKFRDHPSVLAWSIGNETWGLLKHKYSKPYLTKVREHYVKMIETLAQRIHELDPTRPVFTSMEHEKYQLPGELVAFHDHAPSVDVIAINSYYKQQVSRLNHICYQFDSLRPYLISEFGPSGYWDPLFNTVSNGLLVEETEEEKADWYKYQWENYIAPFKGSNIGGVAYCWHDRMEGSYTWFGLSDYKGRLKPGYYALKEAWTGELKEGMPVFRIKSPLKIQPGQVYTFEAVADKPISKDFKYEWFIMKDEFLKKVDNIEGPDNGKTIQLKIPERVSNYRLYLYVSDTHKNVSTASVPVLVK